MGWGRTLLLGDIGTQMNLNDLEREVTSLHDYLQQSRTSTASQTQAIRHLVDENHKLKLCFGLLSRLLLAKNIVTREELAGAADLVDQAATDH